MLGLGLAGCAATPAVRPDEPRWKVVDTPAEATVPAGSQYLFGSGEGAAISIQAWHALTAYAAGAVRNRPDDSVVLQPGASLASPSFVPCGGKPLAAVFDVDETVLLNGGFERDEGEHPGRAYDERRWQAWERTGAALVTPTPGAVQALGALRAMGVTVVFNTNRSLGNVAQTQAAIEGAGIGPARHGETLFVSGDDATGSRKDGRRAVIAAHYCVIAMGGDQLGDFSDLFNAAGLAPQPRRAAAVAAPIARLWGAGWFVLPNPVYGSALKGGFDDVFPGRRWSDAP